MGGADSLDRLVFGLLETPLKKYFKKRREGQESQAGQDCWCRSGKRMALEDVSVVTDHPPRGTLGALSPLTRESRTKQVSRSTLSLYSIAVRFFFVL